ncbi:hypothetical protein HELRODRAFT_161149 [Helobdella robusta]|uniref:IGFBP N-terminal domain-containing protein n=1 Tax=Helobdella robusta TaxID=6412 RepID=T1ER56_HELRO|nr:hypothetical protein HELRODRAFT_161149 [Helobdella robusta]ESO01942.1 hypothetical protein HELRODRAFT_161149 [Helobdella robusta]
MQLHILITTTTLLLILAGSIAGHSCPECDKSSCPTLTSCPGGYVIDACDCCDECAKQVNESCGAGLSSIYGKCDGHLVCKIFAEVGQSLVGNEMGICQAFSHKLK